MTIKQLGCYSTAATNVKLGLLNSAWDTIVITEGAIAVVANQWNYRTLTTLYYADGTFGLAGQAQASGGQRYYYTGALKYKANTYATAWTGGGYAGSSELISQQAVGYRGKGWILGTRVRAGGSGNGVVIRVYFNGGSSGNFRASLFNDAPGPHPSTKVQESGSQAIVAGAWNEVTITSVTITAGGYYWLLFQFDDVAALPHRTTGVTGDSSFYYGFDYAAFPATVASLGTVESDTSSNMWSIYVPYTTTLLGITYLGSTTYPTAIFGDETLRNPGAGQANYIQGTKYTLAVAGTVTKIGIYLATAAGNVRLAIYDDDGASNYPGTLMVETASTAASNGWLDISVTATYLAAGNWWVMENIDSAACSIHWTASTGGTTCYKAYDFGAMPNPFGACTSYNGNFEVRVTYVQIQSYIKGTKAVLDETASSFDKISFYSHSATGHVRLAVFDNANPKALIWESASTALSANAWVDVTITGVTAKAAGTYWLTWQYDNTASAPSYFYAGSSGDGFYKTQAYGAYPATISGETSSTELWSIYVTYSTSVSYTRTAAATISAANTVSREFDAFRVPTQAIGVVLDVQRVLGAVRGSTQGFTIESIPARVAIFSRVFDQVMAFANDPSQWASYQRTAEQPMAISNEVIRVVSFIREPPTQAITLSVEGTRASIFVRGVSQPIAVTPDATAMLAICRSVQQQITMGITPSQWLSFTQTIDQQIALSPVAEGRFLVSRGISQYLQMVNDAVSSGLYDRIIGQTLTFSGTPSYWQAVSRTINQGITMSVTPSRWVSIGRAIQQQITMMMTPSRWASFAQTMNQQITMVMTPSKWISITQIIDQQIALSPVGEGHFWVARGVSQYLQMANDALSTGLYDRTIGQAVTLSGTPSRWQAVAQTINQGVTMGVTPNQWLTTEQFGYSPTTPTGSTTYPITEAGRTGDDTNYSTIPNNDYMAASIFTTTTPLTVTQVHVRIRLTCHIKVALYNNNAGVPGSKIYGMAGGTYCTTLNQYNIIPFDATYIAAGTYWIGIKSDTASSVTCQDGGYPNGQYAASSYTATWPDPFGTSYGAYIYDAHISAVKLKGFIFGTKATLTEAATSFESFTFYSHSAVGNIWAAVYDANKALVWESASTAVTAENNWQTITISGITNKAAGTYYLCWQYDDVVKVPSYMPGPSGDGFYKAQAYGAYPSTISSETSNAEKWSVYVSYLTDAPPAKIFGISGSTSYPTAETITPHGGAQIDTAQSKFGGASALFDGSGDYLTALDSDKWYFSTGAFTIECRVRLIAIGAPRMLIAQHEDSVMHWYLYTRDEGVQDRSLRFWMYRAYPTTQQIYIDYPWNPSLNTWYEIAISRSGNTFYMFIDGVVVATTTSSYAMPNFAGLLYIGSGPGGYWQYGWIDEVRISKGIARHTSDYTPSTARYDCDSYTVLLLHNDLATGEADGSTVFLDDVTTGVAKATKASCTEGGSAVSISFYSHAAGNIRLSISSDSSGPSTKLWESADTPVTAAAWTTIQISAGTPTTLSLSITTYHLSWQWNPGADYEAGPSYTPGVAGDGNYIWQAYGSFPATWTGGTSSSELWSIYVTYTTNVVTSRIATFYRIYNQIMTLANAPSYWKTMSQTINQGITMSVTPSRWISLAKTVNQQIALSPVAEGQYLVNRGVSQYLQMINDAISTGLYYRIIGQILTLSGTPSTWKALARTINQGITMSVSAYTGQLSEAIIQVSLVIANAPSRWISLTQVVEYSLAIANSVTRLGLFLRTPSISLTLAQMVEALNPMINRTVEQAIGLVASVTPQALFNRAATLLFALTDQAKISLFARNVLQAIGLSPSVSGMGIFQRASTVVMTLISTITSLTIRVRILAEELLAIDQLSSIFQQTRILTEGLSVAASLNSYQSLRRLLQVVALIRDTLINTVRSTLQIPLVQPKLPPTTQTDIINIDILNLWGSILMICGIILLSLLILRRIREQRTVVIVQQ
jgi:hypothetical protein